MKFKLSTLFWIQFIIASYLGVIMFWYRCDVNHNWRTLFVGVMLTTSTLVNILKKQAELRP